MPERWKRTQGFPNYKDSQAPLITGQEDKMKSWQEQQEMVEKAAERFPQVFGLRAYPNQEFRIELSASYFSDACGVQLYVFVLRDDRWLDFCKGTPDELRAQIVPLEGK